MAFVRSGFRESLRHNFRNNLERATERLHRILYHVALNKMMQSSHIDSRIKKYMRRRLRPFHAGPLLAGSISWANFVVLTVFLTDIRTRHFSLWTIIILYPAIIAGDISIFCLFLLRRWSRIIISFAIILAISSIVVGIYVIRLPRHRSIPSYIYNGLLVVALVDAALRIILIWILVTEIPENWRPTIQRPNRWQKRALKSASLVVDAHAAIQFTDYGTISTIFEEQ